MHSTYMTQSIPVIDYEGSQYRTDFWVDQGREYEDAVERLILQRLLPASGHRIVEIGAGFGRLADLYDGYEQIVLFDYSRTLLAEAVQQWGDDPRFVFVAGNIYELPLASGVIDTLVMVRVMHHLADVPKALNQLYRVLHPDSCAVLEYANKRNLKSLLRWMSGKQPWSPFDQNPYEFVKLNFDFHPSWMEKQIRDAGFGIRQTLAASHFRLAGLKRTVPANLLAQLDNAIASPGGLFPMSPSVFVQAQCMNDGNVNRTEGQDKDLSNLFCCPGCGSENLKYDGQLLLTCTSCFNSYQQKGRIWDFKEVV